MKILIAGGAGYIGSRLVGELLLRGDDVTVLDVLWFGNNLPRGVKLVTEDIYHIDEKFLEGYDAVIFLAGVSNDPMADYSPQVNYIYNAASPAYLAYITKKAGVKRYIYASSCSVYGNRGDTESVEEDKVISRYPYGISKLQGETAVMGMADEDFSVISLRQGTVCGWSPRMRYDLVINTMYMKAMTEGRITVDNPEIWRPILAISDAVMAYLKALDAPQGTTGVFNVSSFNTTVGEIAEKVREHVKRIHKKDVDMVINQVKNFRNYRVSTEKAKRVLGADFKGSIDSILREIDARAGPNVDFNRDEYYNIRMFKKLVDAKKYLIS